MKKNMMYCLSSYGKWWKILLSIRKKILILLFALTALPLAVYPQEKLFNLGMNDVSVTEVLQELQKQSDYQFFSRKRSSGPLPG